MYFIRILGKSAGDYWLESKSVIAVFAENEVDYAICYGLAITLHVFHERQTIDQNEAINRTSKRLDCCRQVTK